MRGRGGRLVDALVVVLVASAPVVIERLRGLERLTFDLGMMFVPDFTWWWSQARWMGGWNPWLFSGFPANANPLIGHLHPLGLLWAITAPLTASMLEGALAPALAGLGMLAYLRAVGCGRVASLVGAVSFGCGGFMQAHAPHPEKLRSVLAVPWALAAIEALDGRRLVMGLGLATALVVAGGHPQTIAYALLLVAAYALAVAPPRDRRRVAALVAGLGLGVLVPAATWLPAIQLILRSSHVHLQFPGSDTLSASCLRTLVVPFACGGGGGLLYGQSHEAFGACGIIDCTAYPGMVTWLLVLAGVPRLIRDRRGRFWVVAGLVGVVFATGVSDRLVSIPGVRGPSRALLWWSLAMSAAAGLVVHWWVTGEVSRWTRRLVPAVVLLVLVLGWTSTRGPVARRASVTSLGMLGVSSLALVQARRPGRRGLLVAVLVVDLLAFGADLHFGVEPGSFRWIVDELAAVREALHALPVPEAEFGRALVVPMMPGALWASVEHTRLLEGWNVLVPRSYSRLLGDTPPYGYQFGWADAPALFTPESWVLDLLRSRLVVLTPSVSEAEWAARLAAPRWRRLGQVGAWPAYENRRAFPVGWLVHRVRVTSDDEAVRLVRGEVGPFDPHEEALADAAIPELVSPSGPETVTIVTYADDAIHLHVAASAPALLVTSELAYPGWTATVDGAATRVRTVDTAFRAVVVPAGTHDVVFRYRPLLGRIGLALGGASLLVLAACGVLGARGRRQDGAP